MLEIAKSEQIRDSFLGVLLVENVQIRSLEKLKTIKDEAENRLRERYKAKTRAELKVLHPMDSYISYYKSFGYSYHVLPQLESIIKGRSIPEVLPLVEVMFIAELDNMVLTAGHDLDKLSLPLKFSVSNGDESFTAMGGREVMSVSGDLMVSDGESVISSILRGPDSRTAISETTSRALYTAYATKGVEQSLIKKHLNDIASYVKAFSDDAIVSFIDIV